MKICLTGGAGDLGQVLVPLLRGIGATPVIIDPRANAAASPDGEVIRGSILDRGKLAGWLAGSACIVHIAAWHGVHESRAEKSAYDFFDLNVLGTFEVFEAAAAGGVDKIVHISTTSVYRPDTLYGRTKILAERIVEDYVKYRAMNVITLRPRAFIPFWNRATYANYSEWARWFAKGAVHIDDVAAAVMLSIDLLSRRRITDNPILTLDSAYEYTSADLEHWDANGPGSTFRKHYARYESVAVAHGLDPALKPNRLDIAETIRVLGYQPAWSFGRVLAELAAHGDHGPPRHGSKS